MTINVDIGDLTADRECQSYVRWLGLPVIFFSVSIRGLDNGDLTYIGKGISKHTPTRKAINMIWRL